MLTQSCATVDKLCFLHNLNKNSSTLLSSNTSDMKWSAKQTMMVNLSPLFLPTTPLQFVTPQMGRQPSHHYRPSFPLLFAVAAAASLSFLRSFPNQLSCTNLIYLPSVEAASRLWFSLPSMRGIIVPNHMAVAAGH